MDAVGRLGGVDNGAACWVSPGDIQKAVTQAAVKFHIHAFITILTGPIPGFAVSGPGQAVLHRNVEDEGKVGLEITEEEIADFEKLREELLSNPVICGFHDAQEEVQQLQDKIPQVIAKSFELGRVPSQEDFDFCSDGFGHCGCE